MRSQLADVEDVQRPRGDVGEKLNEWVRKMIQPPILFFVDRFKPVYTSLKKEEMKLMSIYIYSLKMKMQKGEYTQNISLHSYEILHHMLGIL